MIKIIVSVLAALATASAHAAEAKYCGTFKKNGVEFLIYGTVVDNTFNPSITGATKDPNQVVNVLQDGQCYCLKGEIFESADAGNIYKKVSHVYKCNGGALIK